MGPNHPGRHEPFVRLDDPSDQLCVRGLLLEVELGFQVRFNLLCECGELQQPGSTRPLLGRVRRGAQQLQVEGHLLLDPRSAHFDHNLAPVLEERRVDLRDRSRCQWLGVDPREASPSSSRMTGSISAKGVGGTSSTSRPSSSV